jgi:lantibiotic biosynthesis protein
VFIICGAPKRKGRDIMIWELLLDGKQAEQAWDAILRIAKALEGYEPDGFSLAGGSAGIAFFFHQLSLARPSDGYRAQAERFFTHATEALANEATNASLYAGFTGVALAGEIMAPASSSEEDPYEDIDEALQTYLAEETWTLDYDLISGLVGLGTYAVERVHRESSRQVLRLVLAHLEALARPVPEGLTWWTSPTLMIKETANEFPNGFYNFGLSHGVPGVIALLARMLRVSFEVARVRPMLEKAVAWLYANQIQPKTDPTHSSPSRAGSSHFPAYFYSREEAIPCRTAWCYGDPGIAAALRLAGEACQNEDWRQEALRLARFAAALTPAEAKIIDIPICHGASGLAHIWNRFYQHTKDAALRESARAWFGQVLGMFREDGFAGVSEWTKLEQAEGFGFRPNTDLLTGATGVGLVLLAGVTHHEPTWDRVLLLSDKS